MKRFKKKRNQNYNDIAQEKVSGNDSKKKNALKIAILTGLIILLFGLGFYFSKTKDNSESQNSGSLNDLHVIESDGQGIDPKPVQTGGSNQAQPAANPNGAATVEDMGGDQNSIQNLDKLLEGKDIKIDNN
jgi:hypothetical protein